MSKFYACKLPNGLQIAHVGQTILLRGANASYNPDTPVIGLNNLAGDEYGFGITELNDKEADAFEAWKVAVTFRHDSDGKPTKEKVSEPFPALDNGAILGPFGTYNEARDEVKLLSSSVRSGFEPVDPDTDEAMRQAGIEKNDEVHKGRGGKK